MKNIIFIAVVFNLYSCYDNNRISQKKKGNNIIEAHFINDSIINGEARFYDLQGKLISIINYNQGIKNGKSISFNRNGKIYDSTNFENGLRNGNHYVFDSTGTIGYNDFYMADHQIGPEIFYKKGIVSAFYFSSLEKFEIYSSFYNETGKFLSSRGRLINANVYRGNINGIPAVGIFSFFVYPPHLNINYELISRDSLNKQEIVIRKFDNEILIDTVMDKLPNNSVYCIKAFVNDSSNDKKQILYEDLIEK